jgi:hypothetical protein
MNTQYFSKNPLDIAIRQLAQRLQRLFRARTSLELVAYSLPLVLGFRSER